MVGGVVLDNIVVVVVVGNLVVVVRNVVVVVGNLVAGVVGNMVVGDGGRANITGQTQSFMGWYLICTKPHILVSVSFRWVQLGSRGYNGHTLSIFYGTPGRKPSNSLDTIRG